MQSQTEEPRSHYSSPGHVSRVAVGIYDANDQPTEAQIRDTEGRIVSRFVRTYDADGRIREEEQIQENRALLMADKLDPDWQPQFNAAQLEGMNRLLKSMFSGRSGTEITMTSNLTVPAGVAFSMDENGTIIPGDAQGRVTEMRDRNFGSDTVTESPALPRENEVRYEYEYDSYGNWTQQTENHGYGPDKPSYVLVRHHKLTYY